MSHFAKYVIGHFVRESSFEIRIHTQTHKQQTDCLTWTTKWLVNIRPVKTTSCILYVQDYRIRELVLSACQFPVQRAAAAM